MRLNRTSELKVITIWISRQLPLFNFKRLYMWCKSDLQVKCYDHLNCSIASIVQFRAPRYILRLNRTSEWNVMTIWKARELPLFNFERLDILCAWIVSPSEKLSPFEFLDSFRCSISSVSIYYPPESDPRVKSYDHLNFSRDSVAQFRASRYIMRLNRTSEWKVMTIWISWELPLFNFERLDILCTWIGPLSETLWPFEFLESLRCSISSVMIYYAPELELRVKSYDHLNFSRASVVQFRASLYIMHMNRTSEWKVMTIWISRELPLFNFERHDILCAWIRPPREKLWPFEFLESFRCSISSVSICDANRTSNWKVMTIWIAQELPLFNFEPLDILCAWIGPTSEMLWPFEFLKSIHCSISIVSIYYAPESDLRVKSYVHLNFSRASVVQFRASRYIMHMNWTSEWKVMTIWISRELPLFNFERHDILCAWIRPPSEKLWLFEFLESFRCSISNVSICDANRTSKWKVMIIWIAQ